MKIKWFKLLLTLGALIICMSVFCLPALAVETEQDIDVMSEYGEQAAETDIEAADETEVVVNTETGEEIIVGTDGTPILSSMYPEGSVFRPFTPPGTGTVVDNAIDSDGKEFYTITTADGDIFYLIIDRQRNTQNVYFLNAVTELDLLALVEKNKREIPSGASVLPNPEQPGTDGQDPPATPEPGTEKPGGSNVMLFVILVAAVGGIGAVYYFKVIKGKKNAVEDDYGDDNPDDEYGYDDETEGNDDDFGDGGEMDE